MIHSIALSGETERDIKRKISSISNGDRFTFFSNGEFACIDVLKILIGKNICENTEIMITTWQLGISQIHELVRIKNNKNVSSFRMLISSSYINRNPKYFAFAIKNLGEFIWLTELHEKIITIKTGDRFYSVLSSANFNKALRLEFFDITESEDMYRKIINEHEIFFKDEPIFYKYNRKESRENFKKIFMRKKLKKCLKNSQTKRRL